MDDLQAKSSYERVASLRKRGSFWPVFYQKERTFLLILLSMIVLSALFFKNPAVAMWLGFAFAAYSAVANDSIQTIGTFIGSNYDKYWWILWLYIGIIFLVTVTISWVVNDGDVSYGRLLDKDANGNLKFPQPQSFQFLQLLAPVVLLIITRLRMPVSTTFLLLSSFSVTSGGITSMLNKSLSGYVIAFVLALVMFVIMDFVIRKFFYRRYYSPWWTVFQWLTSGVLWAVWIMQDAANIAVFLPRSLNFWQFLGFSLTIFAGLGIVFYLKGDKIQQIVNEKTKISDVRAATLVDLLYSVIMVYKLLDSTVPMSTTWVFLGLLGGRELGINLMRRKRGNVHKLKALGLIFKDVFYALIGLIISLILAIGVNPSIRAEFFEMLK